jgi:hypothetical protein
VQLAQVREEIACAGGKGRESEDVFVESIFRHEVAAN